MKYSVTVALLLAPFTVTVFGDDWPQWQGPDRNAMSKEIGLLQDWPASGPPVAWRIEGLGGGYSAPSIADGRIYGMSNHDNDEVVWALSETDGTEQWVTKLGPAKTDGMPQGHSSPNPQILLIRIGYNLLKQLLRDLKEFFRPSHLNRAGSMYYYCFKIFRAHHCA